MNKVKKWSNVFGAIWVLILAPTINARPNQPSRRIDIVSPKNQKDDVGQGQLALKKMKDPIPFPRYLKVFNDTNTPGEVYHQLKNVTSAEWKQWYARTHKNVKEHHTSVEFLQREMFLLRSRGSMSMIGTSRMDEGVLLISRRPFQFQRSEPLAAIADRLSKENLNQRYESGIPFFRMLQMLFGSAASVADTGVDVVRIAPMLALIDIERSRVNCLDLLEAKPMSLSGGKLRRGIASVADEPLPATPECQQALRQTNQEIPASATVGAPGATASPPAEGRQ